MCYLRSGGMADPVDAQDFHHPPVRTPIQWPLSLWTIPSGVNITHGARALVGSVSLKLSEVPPKSSECVPEPCLRVLVQDHSSAKTPSRRG